MEGRSDPGLIRQARKFCEQALEADPGLVRGHIVLGMIHTATGRYELAELELEQALRLDPRNGEAHRNLAELFQSTNKDKEAEAAFRRAIELSPQVWFGYRDYAYFLFRKGRYREAQEQYDKVFKMVPDNLQALCDSASMRLFLGEVETAAGIYERLVKISPYPIYMSNLAQASLYLGRYDRAIQLAEKAAELWSTDAQIVGTLGDIYRWSPGYLAKAAPIYEKAILLTEKRLLINPNDVEDLADLAAYLAKTGRKERALAEIRKAVSLHPSDVRIRGLEAVVYEACGMRNEALQALREAISLGFTLPEIKLEPEFKQLFRDPRFGEIEEPRKSKTATRR
jgi:tetratricopeptide (TPR) repeat protein